MAPPKKRPNAPGARLDPGWAHGIEINPAKKEVQCKYCFVTRSGGIFRLKHHLAGTHHNVEPCSKVPDDVKDSMLEVLSGNDESKKKSSSSYDISSRGSASIQEDIASSMGRFAARNVNVKQTTIRGNWKKDERDDVCRSICRWMYTSAIAFNTVTDPNFPIMLEKVGAYGKGLKPPSYHEVRETFLRKEVEDTMKLIETYKVGWQKTGCTIMSDGWVDQRKRSMNNFLINSPAGTVFLTSVDTTDISKTAEKLFSLLDDIIERIGEANVVQVITDNASNYKKAGKLLMEKRKSLYWTPCAAHCIDLMLEDFEKLDTLHKVTIKKARTVVTNIYSWATVVHWMKEFTSGKELIRPSITRFATAYLTLRRLFELKNELISFFSSEKWTKSAYAKKNKGLAVYNIIFDLQGFWKNVDICIKVANPLIKVLRMVDSDEPSMGFLYKAIESAKVEINENLSRDKKRYKAACSIIDTRWRKMLCHPLHSAGYLLNPRYFYEPNFVPESEVKKGFYDCLLRMVPNKEERLKINLQFDKYKKREGMFAYDDAFDLRMRKSPADWWDSFGDDCKELQRFAIRVLSLTCSSSGCERNWSAFERVHSKRRNRLAQKRMNDLVFVMYNLKLKERKMKRQRDRNAELEDLAFEDLPSDDEWITEKENPALPKKGKWLGIFDENEDCTTDEEEEIDDVEFITSQVRKAYNAGPSGSCGKRKRSAESVVEIDENTENEEEGEEETGNEPPEYNQTEPNDPSEEFGEHNENFGDEEDVEWKGKAGDGYDYEDYDNYHDNEDDYIDYKTSSFGNESDRYDSDE